MNHAFEPHSAGAGQPPSSTPWSGANALLLTRLSFWGLRASLGDLVAPAHSQSTVGGTHRPVSVLAAVIPLSLSLGRAAERAIITTVGQRWPPGTDSLPVFGHTGHLTTQWAGPSTTTAALPTPLEIEQGRNLPLSLVVFHPALIQSVLCHFCPSFVCRQLCAGAWRLLQSQQPPCAGNRSPELLQDAAKYNTSLNNNSQFSDYAAHNSCRDQPETQSLSVLPLPSRYAIPIPIALTAPPSNPLPPSRPCSSVSRELSPLASSKKKPCHSQTNPLGAM
ncbi:predicted protein [Histoplasma capsulatum var. duboisii H88]|uniref:Predicted protein n=2 Tax=Ajellomyces capsulatus TaxID=5037 RepID=F0U7Y2_AJEC8|nr:predicted protein [Histoplasma capsulatum H143]EGC40804.1 predicted protein [Histoplasma capsulatum var. duboisii H88]